MMRVKRMPLLEQSVPNRCCWSCEHVEFYQGSPGYSEMTPGNDFELECGKDYWEFDNCGDTLDDFREKLELAERCADFKERV